MEIENNIDNAEKVKYVLKSNASLGMCFLRNLWIYIIYIILVAILKIYQNDIVAMLPTISNIDISGLFILIFIVLFVITLLIYLKISVGSFKKVNARKCSLYNSYLVYENQYAIIKEKDVTYANINKVVIEKNILDYIFKTGTIRIKKAVEYDEGMAIDMIKNPKEVLKDIESIVKINY